MLQDCPRSVTGYAVEIVAHRHLGPLDPAPTEAPGRVPGTQQTHGPRRWHRDRRPVNAARDRYVVRAIRGDDLTGEKPRSLRLAEIVGDALGNMSISTVGDATAPSDLFERFGDKAEDFSKLGEDERVHIVSLLYAFAYITGQRPTAYVTEMLGIPRSTANRLIKKGRMGEQWLGTTTERKAGI